MIKLARTLEMPHAAVTQTFAFLGKRGGGKTYAATKLAEEMLTIGAQVIALDVVGVWYGLRVPKKKNGKAFDITVFGGLNGDIEINPKAGKIVAGIILERNISAVVDISQFVQSEQMRFAYDFLITLFEGRKTRPGACHVFLEEAQELVPQNLPKSDSAFGAKMLNAGERLVKLGRNFGIGCSLISQRPQEVNKKVLNQTEVLLVFQMTGLQERKTIKEWVRDKGTDFDETYLTKLATGEALVWSPTWLKISGTYRIAEKITADVSATPEVGSTELRVNTLTKVDVAELRESIESLTAEMEANTPAALKKRIIELERELSGTKKALTETNRANNERKPPITETIEVPVLDQETLARIKEAIDNSIADWRSIAERFRAEYDEFVLGKGKELRDLLKELQNAKPALPSNGKKHARPTRPGGIDLPATPQKYTNGTVTAAQSTNSDGLSSTGARVSGPQQKLLDTLALFETFNVTSVKRSNLAAFAGVSPKSSGFEKNLSTLRNHPEGSFINYLPDSCVGLTDLGRAAANEPNSLFVTNADVLNAWCQYISNPQGVLLRILFDLYPNSIHRETLALKANVSAASSGFEKNLSTMRSLGLIDYGPGKTVFATELLFPFS